MTQPVKPWTLWFVAGSRDEVARLTPVVRALRVPDSPVDVVTCLGGQELALGDDADFGPDRDLRGRGASRSHALAGALVAVDDLLEAEHPTAVVLAGDSTAALATALGAHQRERPVLLLQAASSPDGESMNRRLVAQLVAANLPSDAGAAAVIAWLRARDRPANPPGIRRRAVWVAGFPSPYGGADTELDHQISLWRRREVDVHLVPMFGADARTRERMLARGCSIHEYRDDIFRGQVVVSYCNGEFLAHLPRIMAAGRPAKVVWFNCMTWLFDGEREAHRQGWIDLFGFVSAYQRSLLEPQLAALGRVRSFSYRPYFDLGEIEWRYRPWNGTYRVGRISRDDAGKYAADTWRIFDRVIVPPGLAKKVYLLGYGANAAAKIGPAPSGLDWQTWAPGGIPASDFYRTIDTLIHKTGGSRESYCRVVIEAYAHGVVPIVEDDYAFPEIVVHGETGFRASESDEMSWYAGLLARDPERHRTIAERGRRFLVDSLIDEEACWRGWEEIL